MLTLTSIKIQTLRHRLGLTYKEMGDYLGVSSHLIRKYENGTREMSRTVVKLLELLEKIEEMSPEEHAKMIGKVV